MSAKQATIDSQIKDVCEGSSIYQKLLEIQKRCSGVVVFDSVNPHFKNKYASLEQVLEKLLPVANEVGLVITQKIAFVDGFWCVRTIVMDNKSIEELACMPVINPKGDAQGFGSALSYAKRYSLMAAFQMVGGQEDDDAEATTGRGDGKAQKIEPKKPVTYQGTKDDMTKIADMMKKSGIADQTEMRKLAASCLGKSWEECDMVITDYANYLRSLK